MNSSKVTFLYNFEHNKPQARRGRQGLYYIQSTPETKGLDLSIQWWKIMSNA